MFILFLYVLTGNCVVYNCDTAETRFGFCPCPNISENPDLWLSLLRPDYSVHLHGQHGSLSYHEGNVVQVILLAVVLLVRVLFIKLPLYNKSLGVDETS